MKTLLSPVAAALGIVLLVLSAAWGSLFPAERTWTEEKSNRLSELGAQANLLKFELVEAENNTDPRKSPEYLQASYQKVREEYDQLHAEFEAARDRPQTAGAALRWTAFALIAVAAVTMLINRQQN